MQVGIQQVIEKAQQLTNAFQEFFEVVATVHSENPSCPALNEVHKMAEGITTTYRRATRDLNTELDSDPFYENEELRTAVDELVNTILQKKETEQQQEKEEQVTKDADNKREEKETEKYQEEQEQIIQDATTTEKDADQNKNQEKLECIDKVVSAATKWAMPEIIPPSFSLQCSLTPKERETQTTEEDSERTISVEGDEDMEARNAEEEKGETGKDQQPEKEITPQQAKRKREIVLPDVYKSPFVDRKVDVIKGLTKPEKNVRGRNKPEKKHDKIPQEKRKDDETAEQILQRQKKADESLQAALRRYILGSNKNMR